MWYLDKSLTLTAKELNVHCVLSKSSQLVHSCMLQLCAESWTGEPLSWILQLRQEGHMRGSKKGTTGVSDLSDSLKQQQ